MKIQVLKHASSVRVSSVVLVFVADHAYRRLGISTGNRKTPQWLARTFLGPTFPRMRAIIARIRGKVGLGVSSRLSGFGAAELGSRGNSSPNPELR